MPTLASLDGQGKRRTVARGPSAPPARLILSDPPWKFGDSLPGKGRGAVKHYPCMSVQELKRFPLPRLADDCLLLMWRCAAMQVEALSLMQAWGFVPKSEIVWLKLTRGARTAGETSKLHFGMGRYVRASHEVCLIGVRGRIEVADHAVRSVFAAPVQEHSRKPDEIYEIAERLVPGGPYVELFGRRTRAGWTVLGNEVVSR
jgi:N6-adenosine-specific RNA methylase IME4